MPKVDKLKEPKQDDTFRTYMEELGDWQEADLDQRQQAREADRFMLDKDGQWEDSIRRQIDSQQRPRYTFDKTTPALEAMMADIEDMDFGCNVKPAGYGSDKDTADTMEGMIRSIEVMSRADKIYRDATRRTMRRGFDAWMVRADYADDWSFEQDLFIKKIPNAINRVWVSPSCAEEDSSDTPAVYVLTSMSPDEYKKEFPDGNAISVSDSDIDEHYDEYRPEVITIAERYYPKDTMIEIVQMSNGEVYKVDDNFKKIKDELAEKGIVVKKEKKVKDIQWQHITFDGGGFLTKETATVFRTCPVVTVYGNFELLGQNNKVTYSGFVLKAMDAQRVHNYAKSREIEEGALAPRKKTWMTPQQAKGHEDQLGRMNISPDPIQFYDHVQNQPIPFQTGGPEVNQHLAAIGLQMQADINAQSGIGDAMRGDFAARQSEEALRMQIDRGTAATRKWINSTINGIRRTCEIMVQTIPYVYDTERQFVLTNNDGTEDQVVINQEIFDNDTQKMVKVNNLNQGKYKVVCDAGPAFSNRLEAGLAALLELAAIDPNVIAQGGDLMLKAIDAPLVDELAVRRREAMLLQGLIPESQMTDEEKQQAQARAQAQAQQPDPNMILASAEAEARQKEGEAAIMNEVNDARKLEIDQQKVINDTARVQIQAAEAGVKIEEKKAGIRGKQVETVTKILDRQTTTS
ncbi:putative portal protein [Vibrio phage 340E47.2]|nr:putative portal protein [Vibrio phage 340E47.2]